MTCSSFQLGTALANAMAAWRKTVERLLLLPGKASNSPNSAIPSARRPHDVQDGLNPDNVFADVIVVEGRAILEGYVVDSS